jgi:DNA-binding transcriptional MerR regulator
MKMQKRQFRIGELAHYLNVEKFVIRFWEKEFDMHSIRSAGGQRFYYEKDIEKFVTIKDLLYQKGYTIAGAKQQLKEKAKRKLTGEEEPRILPSHRINIAPEKSSNELTREELEQQIVDLQKKLLKLRELL